MIRVIDLETCGEAPPAPVVEIGWCDVLQANGFWIVGDMDSVLVDPGQPIPPAMSAIHHIIDEDVAGAHPWEVVRGGACVTWGIEAYAAHSAKFERQWITDDIKTAAPWICTWKCALRLWPDEASHSNQALRYSRKPAGLDRVKAYPAHRAGQDAYVTAHHLRDMLNGGATVEQLIQWSSEPAALVRIGFGKHRGMAWGDVPMDYLQWVIRQADMDEDTLFTARREMSKRMAAKNRQTHLDLPREM